VSQLEGGIHRYLEMFGGDGFFKGKNATFDARGFQSIQGDTSVLTQCFHCGVKDDTRSSDRVCCVCCSCLFVCDKCRVERAGVYVCVAHKSLDGIFYHFLDDFSLDELVRQREGLQAVLDEHDTMRKQAGEDRRRMRAEYRRRRHEDGQRQIEVQSADSTEGALEKGSSCDQASLPGVSTSVYHDKNRRRTTRKQLDRVVARIQSLRESRGRSDAEIKGHPGLVRVYFVK
jgi:hypothetical protein